MLARGSPALPCQCASQSTSQCMLAPLELTCATAMALRLLLLLALRCHELGSFGEGLAEWSGPSAFATGLLVNLSNEQLAACDIMCRGSALVSLSGCFAGAGDGHLKSCSTKCVGRGIFHDVGGVCCAAKFD